MGLGVKELKFGLEKIWKAPIQPMGIAIGPSFSMTFFFKSSSWLFSRSRGTLGWWIRQRVGHQGKSVFDLGFFEIFRFQLTIFSVSTWTVSVRFQFIFDFYLDVFVSISIFSVSTFFRFLFDLNVEIDFYFSVEFFVQNSEIETKLLNTISINEIADINSNHTIEPLCFRFRWNCFFELHRKSEK